MKLSTALAQIHFTRKKNRLFGNAKNHEAVYTGIPYLSGLWAVGSGRGCEAQHVRQTYWFLWRGMQFAACDLVSELWKYLRCALCQPDSGWITTTRKLVVSAVYFGAKMQKYFVRDSHTLTHTHVNRYGWWHRSGSAILPAALPTLPIDASMTYKPNDERLLWQGEVRIPWRFH